MTQREILEPFPAKTIKQVPRGGGGTADFVSWTDKIQRLMQLGVLYDWTIVGTFASGDEREPVAVHGRLTVKTEASQSVLIDSRTFDGIGQGRDAKTASTDAFSRACAFLGLGLHLWCQGGTKDGGYWITGALDGAK